MAVYKNFMRDLTGWIFRIILNKEYNNETVDQE